MNDLVSLKKKIEERKRITEWMLANVEGFDGHDAEFEINDDLTIDVIGLVNIDNKGLTELPDFINFGKVSLHFWVDSNKLSNFKGFPKSIGGSLDLEYNNYTTFEGAPIVPNFCDGNPCTPIYNKLEYEDAHKECRKVWI